jgi:hypothetical protein
MTESRLRGLTIEELEAVAAGAGQHKGFVTSTTVLSGPDHKTSSSTTVLGPYGQNKF